MKKLLSLLTILAMMLSLCACAQTPPETVPATTVPETTVPETTVQTEPTEPPAVFADYEYRYEEGRDRKWETDIVYMAKCYLGELVPASRHPKLVNKGMETRNFTGGNYKIDLGYFYDASVRSAFCEAIEDLILRIPELRDEEIVFGMQKAVALLSDGHSSVFTQDNLYFPFVAEVLESEDGLGLHVTRILKEYENCVFAKLTAVNGVPVEEILERLLPAISQENPYSAEYPLFHLRDQTLFFTLWAMQVTGVIPWEEQSADFTLLTRSGEETTLHLTAMHPEDKHGTDFVTRSFFDLHTGLYSNYYQENYHWTYLSDEKSLYIRINRLEEEAECRIDAFVRQLQEQMDAAPETEKVIIDLRSNPGGFYEKFAQKLLSFLEGLNSQQVYVLTDSGTFSAATAMAAVIRQTVDGCNIAGTPSGQSPRFFAAPATSETPNFDVAFTVATNAWECWEGYESDALMPDIPVRQTVEDYLNGVDTVLETVLHMEQEVNP